MTTGDLSFCESVDATPTSPVHLREVGPEGRKYGGGVPTPALCGRDLHRGCWDLPTEVTSKSVAAADQDRPGRICASCAAVYDERKLA
jgi:hypothetical protein